MEQLFVACGNNGKAVLCQLLAQQRVEVLQLLGVDKVTHVHPLSFVYVEVQLQQLVLTLLQSFHKCLFLISVFQCTCLVSSTIVVVAPRLALLLLDAFEVDGLVKLPHQRVIPRRAFVDASYIGILEGETLTGGRSVAEHAQVADAKGRHVHVVVDAIHQLLHVNLRHRHRYHTLFLTACGHDADYASH